MSDTALRRRSHAAPSAPRGSSEFRRFARRFCAIRSAWSGLLIVAPAAVLRRLCALARDARSRICPRSTDRLSAPSAEYWFGADELGRDIYSRLVYGSRLTLLIVGARDRHLRARSACSSAPSPARSAAGSTPSSCASPTCSSPIPKLLLALAFVAALGPGIVNAALAITLTAWPPYARLARAEALVVRNSDYVNAIRLAGASEFRIIVFHVIPMCLQLGHRAHDLRHGGHHPHRRRPRLHRPRRAAAAARMGRHDLDRPQVHLRPMVGRDHPRRRHLHRQPRLQPARRRAARPPRSAPEAAQ